MTRSDIIIIGAGVIGCSIAYELGRRGASVQVVDDRPAGMGATQASAGVLAPYIEAHEGGPLFDLTARSLDRFDGFLARVMAASGVDVAYRRTGTLDVALHDDTIRRFKSRVDALARRGVAAELIDGERVRIEEPHLTNLALGGMAIASHGFVAAGELTRALTLAARRHGVNFAQRDRVRRIRSGAGDLVIETDTETLEGSAVVLAAGSWSGQVGVEGASAAPVRPVRGQLLQLAWNGAPLRRVTWSERCYLVPWDDGTVLVGATVEDAGFDERTTVAGVHDLMAAAAELVPHARTASFQAARAGLRPATPDDLPLVGWSTVLP